MKKVQIDLKKAIFQKNYSEIKNNVDIFCKRFLIFYILIQHLATFAIAKCSLQPTMTAHFHRANSSHNPITSTRNRKELLW